MLSPWPFTISINDLIVVSNIGWKVSPEEDVNTLQVITDQLSEWVRWSLILRKRDVLTVDRKIEKEWLFIL